MPTIVLRHVSKRFGPQELPDPGRAAMPTARIFDASRTQNTDRRRAAQEPPDRSLALDDLSLTVRNGETLSVLGPSGCGKTTLLKVIAGLLKPDSGEISYDGVPIQAIPIAERGIGMVFQTYALYPHMEARENIGFYDIVRHQPEKIPERIRHIVEVMGIEVTHLLSRKPPTLSGGEQQRVAVARCLAREPKLFLFDEPLSNLDAKLRVDTRLQLNRLLRHYQITSVYVTHDQAEAIALAHRIAIMRAGKIEQVGTAHALYEAPVNAFVAQFFGTPPMNLFLGHVFSSAWEGLGFQVSSIRPGLRQGQAVWLGIRPENITLDDHGIAARVEFTELILSQQSQLVYVTVSGQRCTVRAPLSTRAEPGDLLHLRFPPEHLYFFDHASGARIG
ncbi:MAG: ABC transporter ATP-binding protein [Anaerolineae bacterium]|nr:ABC transporter ATP-binding protein [Anaerolineae bacterium]